MKNSGLKNEAQVAKIFVSGSSVLPQTNDSGVRLFKESDLSDGIISGKLIRPKYNTKELKKSIDTDIFELLPNLAPDLPDTVLRSTYNEALARIDDDTYGYCEETGEPISIARLDARPVATLSLEAQERHERMEKTHRDD